MKFSKTLAALALASSSLFATSSWGAHLTISETVGGVFFFGDGGFTANDWLGGAVQTQFGLERAHLSVGLSNPNYQGGIAGAELITIFDSDGVTVSDLLFMTYTRSASGSTRGTFTADFCSGDVSACQSAANSWTASSVVFSRTDEDQQGNFSFGFASGPNFSGSGNSPEHVPEPGSLALLGLGLLAACAVRRKRA